MMIDSSSSLFVSVFFFVSVGTAGWMMLVGPESGNEENHHGRGSHQTTTETKDAWELKGTIHHTTWRWIHTVNAERPNMMNNDDFKRANREWKRHPSCSCCCLHPVTLMLFVVRCAEFDPSRDFCRIHSAECMGQGPTVVRYQGHECSTRPVPSHMVLASDTMPCNVDPQEHQSWDAN